MINSKLVFTFFAFAISQISMANKEWKLVQQSEIHIKSGQSQTVAKQNFEPGFYAFIADQSNLDVTLSIKKAYSERVNVNSLVVRTLNEKLFFEVESSVDIAFIIGAFNQSNISANVSYSIIQLIDDVNQHHRTQALLLITQGSLANSVGEALSLERNFNSLMKSIEAFKIINNTKQLAELYFMAGLLAYERFKWNQSEEFLKHAMLFFKSQNSQIYASIANHLGAALLEKKAYDEALEYLDQAIKIQTENNFLFDLGVSLNNKGLYYLYLGKNKESGQLFVQSSELFDKIGVQYKQGMSIGNYAVTELYQGRYYNAMKFTNQCLELLNNDLPNIRAAYLANLAQAQEKTGDIQSALISLNQAKEIQLASADSSGMVWTLSGMADLARKILHFETALNYQTQAVKLAKSQNEHGSLINGILNLAHDHLQIASRENDSVHLVTANELFKEAISTAKSNVHKSKAYLGLAKTSYEMKNKDAATAAIDSAYQAINEIKEPDVALLASLYLEEASMFSSSANGERKNLLNQALETLKPTANQKLKFRIHHELAKSHLESAELAQANSQNLAALELFLAHRDKVGNPWLRNNLSEWYHQLIDTQLLILERLGQPDAAIKGLTLVDSLKAISLREQIAESKSNLYENLNQEQAEAWHTARQNLMEALKMLDDVKHNAATEDVIKNAQVEVNKARLELETARAKINAVNSRFDGLMSTGDVVLSDYTTWLKNHNQENETETTIIDYFIGKTKSYAWMINAKGVSQWSLPAGNVIDESISRYFDSLLTNSDQVTESLQQLSSMLLPDVEIPTGRLFIIPDGQLNTIPFASLIMEDNSSRQFLVETNQISISPSISILIGNRIVDTNTQMHVNKPMLLVSGSIPGHSLTYTNSEINRVKDVWSGKSEIFEQGQDSLNEFNALELDQYEYLHFATHGKIDEKVPESNGLAFTDEQNTLAYLNLAKIYQLKLSSRLVTLSACDSAQGTQLAGEGVMGLARGFIYAGSEAVLATLWKVPDRSTMLFMERFYQELDETNDSAYALKNTQLAAISGGLGRGLRAYKNWAGFILIGR